MLDNDTPKRARPWRVLMIGDGRSPGQLEDFELRLRRLVDELPEIRGVVAGTNEPSATDRTRSVGKPGWPMALRLLLFTRLISAEAKDADIIDVHSALHAFLPLLLGVFANKEIVVHVDGQRRDTEPRRSTAPAARSLLQHAVERHVYRHAALVITPTGASKRVLVEDFGVSPWRVRVLAQSVGLAYVAEGDREGARARLSIPANAFVACCVRPLVSAVGLRILLDAWSQLMAEREPGPHAVPLRLLVARQDEMPDGLAEGLEVRGLCDSVVVYEPASDAAVANLYRAADLQIVPWRPVERRGRIVLEAATCGTPSVVVLPAGMPDALEELDETLVVAGNDPNALATRLRTAANGYLPSEKATVAWAQRHRVSLAEQHRAIYDEILGASPTPQKLRVAYIGHVAQLSGGEIAMTRLIDALPEVEAHVILAEDGPLVARLLAAGISVEVLPMRERTLDLRKDRIAPRRLPVAGFVDTANYSVRLARRLRVIKPDVVHTNTLKAGVYGSIAARLTRTPSVWHVRDRIAPDYLPWTAVVLFRRLITIMPSAVIANSEATRATLRSPDKSTLVVHSIVDDPVVAPRPRVGPPRSETFVVGMVGRLAPWKGQDVFLRAFAMAFRDGSERAIIVGSAMFGSAEVHYASELRKLAASLEIADRVDFRGFREDVWAELAEMDALVHASITPEPFGQVIVEAMIAGVPVIATAGGGPSEIVTDGVDGLLYPPGDVDALCAGMERLADNPELRARLSAHARKRATTFSPQAAAAGAMSIYRRVRPTFDTEHKRLGVRTGRPRRHLKLERRNRS